MTARGVDDQVRSVALRQHGAFSWRQARQAGADGALAQRRLAAGVWLHLDRGVHALAGHPSTWLRQVAAAQLAVPGALVTGVSAGVLHGLDGCRPGHPELLVAHGRHVTTALADVTRTRRALDPARIEGLAVASLPLTILQLSRRCPPTAVGRTLDDAVVRGLVDPVALATFLGTVQRDRGAPAVRAWLREELPGAAVAESVLELVLGRAIRDAELTGVQFQQAPPWWPDGPGRVDATVALVRVILEADGRCWHDRRTQAEVDRRRDNLAAQAGWRVLRFTAAMLRSDRPTVIALLRSIAAEVRASERGSTCQR